MTFTRLLDDDTLTPVMVFGPYEQARETRHIIRQVLQSAEVRVSYSYQGYRRGEYQLLFNTYAEAQTASDWFSSFSLYTFNGPPTSDVLIQVGGYLEESPGDEDYALRFAVAPGEMTITQNGLWELRVPYQEVPE